MIIAAPPDHVEATAPPQGPHETVGDLVTRLARTKAAAVAENVSGDRSDVPDRMILACDTLGEIDDTPLGKPADRADAGRMINALAGRIHRVVTGVSLWIPSGTASRRQAADNVRRPYTIHDAVAESTVLMEPIDAKAIEAYLASEAWRGKAGSCGLQDGLLPLRLVSGTADTVVGLPVALVEQLVADHRR